MKISVVIPTFNRAKYIYQAVESVLNQTVPVHEIIVIDDGSTDNTKLILKKYVIKYVYQKNGGVSNARNNGLRRAKGDIIALLDSDDLWKPDKIEKQIKLFKKKDIDFAFTDMLETANGKLIRKSWAKTMSYYQYLKNNSDSLQLIKYLFTKNCIPTSSVMFRKKCLKTVGFFNEKLKISEDREYWIRLCNNHIAGFIDESLVEKREHSTNLVLNVELMLESRLDFFSQLTLKKGKFSPKNLDDLRRIAIYETYFQYSRYYLKSLKFRKSYSYLRLLFPAYLYKPTYLIMLLVTAIGRIIR